MGNILKQFIAPVIIVVSMILFVIFLNNVTPEYEDCKKSIGVITEKYFQPKVISYGREDQAAFVYVTDMGIMTTSKHVFKIGDELFETYNCKK